MRQFTCVKCHGTFNSRWTEAECAKEYADAPWNVPDDQVELVCDDCFQKFKIWFDGLTPEDHERIRSGKNK